MKQERDERCDLERRWDDHVDNTIERTFNPVPYFSEFCIGFLSGATTRAYTGSLTDESIAVLGTSIGAVTFLFRKRGEKISNTSLRSGITTSGAVCGAIIYDLIDTYLR